MAHERSSPKLESEFTPSSVAAPSSLRDYGRGVLASLVSGDEDDIRERLVEHIRRSGIKFRSRAAFDQLGWGRDPLPPFESFYRVQSGRVVAHSAPYIWDLRESLMRNDTLLLAALLMHRRLQTERAIHLVGLETAAIPLLSGILIVNALLAPSRSLRCAYLRKKRKPDGLRRLLEGARIPRGTDVVVVDDVLNKGTRKREVVEYCRANQLSITKFLVVVDTECPIGSAFKAVHPVEALLTKSELFAKRPANRTAP